MEAMLIWFILGCVTTLTGACAACGLRIIETLTTRSNESRVQNVTGGVNQTQTRDVEQGIQRNQVEAGSGALMATQTQQEQLVSVIKTVDLKNWNCSMSECAICLENFKDGEQCRVLRRCKHGYHVACIDEWLGKDKHCPLCRDSVRGRR